VTVTSVCVVPFRMGSVSCQISQVPRTGAGTYADGDLRVTLWLRLSMDVLGNSQDCDLCVTLAADWVEPPTRGPVTVLGAVTCRRGYLAGRSAMVALNGTISPAEVRRGDRP